MRKVCNYAVIGAGLRIKDVLENVVPFAPGIALKWVCDPQPQRRKKLIDLFGSSETKEADDYQQVLQDDSVEWVFIGTPNNLHCEHIIAALRAGKHVFAEKPLATSIEDAIKIRKTHDECPGQILATGFVLRYSKLYQKIKELLDDGYIGKLLTVSANENITPAHGGHIMTCWRRHSEISGSHILEKCCHDIDLINWFVQSVPMRVASFGGLDYFTPEHSDDLNRFVDEETQTPIFLSLDIPARDCQDPFMSAKSIVDNQVTIFEYANNVRVSFETTLCNAIPERRMRFNGTHGTIIAEAYSNRLECRRIDESETNVYQFDSGNGHAGGDVYIGQQIADCMLNDAEPLCNVTEGLLSTIASLAAEQARIKKEVVLLEN